MDEDVLRELQEQNRILRNLLRVVAITKLTDYAQLDKSDKMKIANYLNKTLKEYGADITLEEI